jgi:type IX secretion system PorP/SprF family membrane protein
MKSKYMYHTKKGKFIFAVIAFLFSANTLFAQYEPMFTQYSFNEMFINPAYTGSHEALSISGLYRKQWVNIEGAPTTQTLTVHSPFANKKVGLGLTFYNDEIGVTQQTGAYLNYAFRVKMNESTLSFGLLGGVDGIQERLQEVRTTEGSDKQFMANTNMLFAPNFGFGMYFSTKRYYIGGSVPRFLVNKLTINQQQGIEKIESEFEMEDLHYFFATGYVFDLNPVLKMKPSVMLKTVVNAPIEYDANLAFLFNNTLWVGGGFRSGDAVNGMIAIYPVPQLRVGYSYDYTLSGLQNYNSGSHEISLNYIFSYNKKKVTSPRYF